MKSLGQFIRELRDERDISLRELAQKLGLSATFVSDIELGKRHPSDEVLGKIGKVLGVPLTKLKEHDTRLPVEELKQITANDPRFAAAFRTVVEKNVSPEDLLRLARGKTERPKS